MIRNDDLCSIAVHGLPADFRDREFLNMFAFCSGLEWAELRRSAADANANADTDTADPVLIGVARFRTRLEALEAMNTLNNHRVDASSVIRVEMAKRGTVGPTRDTLRSADDHGAQAPQEGSRPATPLASGKADGSPTTPKHKPTLAVSTAVPPLSTNSRRTDPGSTSARSPHASSPSDYFSGVRLPVAAAALADSGASTPAGLPTGPAQQYQASESASTPSLQGLRIPPPALQRNPSPQDQNPPCNTLYVGNLPPSAREEELRALFQQQPGYRRLVFRPKPGTGPMCFVEFVDIPHAFRALNDLHGWMLSSSVKSGIRLSFSKNPLGVRQNPSTSQQQAVQQQLAQQIMILQSAAVAAAVVQQQQQQQQQQQGPSVANLASSPGNSTAPNLSGSLPLSALAAAAGGVPSSLSIPPAGAGTQGSGPGGLSSTATTPYDFSSSATLPLAGGGGGGNTPGSFHPSSVPAALSSSHASPHFHQHLHQHPHAQHQHGFFGPGSFPPHLSQYTSLPASPSTSPLGHSYGNGNVPSLDSMMLGGASSTNGHSSLRPKPYGPPSPGLFATRSMSQHSDSQLGTSPRHGHAHSPGGHGGAGPLASPFSDMATSMASLHLGRSSHSSGASPPHSAGARSGKKLSSSPSAHSTHDTDSHLNLMTQDHPSLRWLAEA